MDYVQQIGATGGNPEALERLYRTARQEGQAGPFAAALEACYAQTPGNVLYAAWHYRLAQESLARAHATPWGVAVPLAAVAGLFLALLTKGDLLLPGQMPYLLLLWAPIGAAAIIAFLALAGRRNWREPVLAILGLAVAAAYAVVWARQPGAGAYRTLMVLHLPLVAWIAVAVSVLGVRPDRASLFALLGKSVEVLITGGVYLIVAVIFGVIVAGMFSALAVRLPEELSARLAAAAVGAVAVLAVASVYDPRRGPTEQTFEQGVGKLLLTMTRLLLGPALVVLAIYLALIPFRFMEPFEKREVLIVYNAMLFAIMGLLIGVTPVQERGLGERARAVLRVGIVAVAALAAVISLYALSATVYRTVVGGITVNRLTVLGWNAINIGVLALILYRQARSRAEDWMPALQGVAWPGAVAYVVWTAFLLAAVPLLFAV